MDLTHKQKQIQAFITQCFEERGIFPTLREIGGRFGVSAGTAQYHVAALQAKGFLKREKAKARSFFLTAKSIPARQIPILGRVGAGGGLIAQEDVEGHFSFKNFALGTDFLLRVKGESMTGAGILDGDLVQVRRQAAARPGDIVVALVAEEGVVKRLRGSGRRSFLESANPAYRPIRGDFQIIGKVVGLLRRYGK